MNILFYLVLGLLTMGLNFKKQVLFDEIKYLSKKGHYILGIWLGMQLLFQKSEESESDTRLSLKGRTKKLKKVEIV